MKSRTCSVDGCIYPVWGNGLCKKHSPAPPPIRSMKRKGEDGRNRRNAFFTEIWRERPHVCQHCGAHLGYNPRSYMFDHLLEKEKHPNLEYEKENIWLVCLQCHDEKTRGILSDKYKEKITFVRTKFDLL